MNYYDLVKYCDTIFARKFEGLPIYYDFTQAQMHDIFEVNKWGQINKFSKEAREIWMSKVFQRPFKHIESIVSKMKELIVSTDLSLAQVYDKAIESHPKYFMYSSHDVQMGVIWDFVSPIIEMKEWYYIPYASYLEVSLKYDESCI